MIVMKNNQGSLQIIQIGPPKNLGPIRHSKKGNSSSIRRLGVLAKKENERKSSLLEKSEFFTDHTSKISGGKLDKENSIELSTSACLRICRTSDVLHVKTEADTSGVAETNLGIGVSHSGLGLGQYVTLISRLDLMVQWTSYSNEKVSDLLNYRFSLAKASLVLNFPGDWVLTPTIDYNLLNSQSREDRMFDAVAPSINVQKATVFQRSVDSAD